MPSAFGWRNDDRRQLRRLRRLDRTERARPPLRPILIENHARLGRTLHLHLLTDPGTSIILALGQTIPGVGIGISPLEGSAETLVNVQLAVPFAAVTGEQYTHPVQVPDDPTLLGQSITFQGVALTSLAPLAGAFSNPLTLVIQP